MMGKDVEPLAFSCSCGNLRGHIAADALASGTRVGCYCRDCRAAYLYLEQPDPAPGPVDLFLTTPDQISITEGAGFLAPFRLSPRGPLRWRTTCCNTPLCSSGSGPKIPFAGFQTAALSDPDRLGPIVTRVYVPKGDGKTAHRGIMRLIVRLLPQVLAARVSGRWRKTPFFTAGSGDPVAEPTVLSGQERAALYPAQRSIKG